VGLQSSQAHQKFMIKCSAPFKLKILSEKITSIWKKNNRKVQNQNLQSIILTTQHVDNHIYTSEAESLNKRKVSHIVKFLEI
jgi:hypothetical protein